MLLAINVALLDVVLAALAIATAVVYRRFRRPIPPSGGIFAAPADAAFESPLRSPWDAFTAPRPDEEPPW